MNDLNNTRTPKYSVCFQRPIKIEVSERFVANVTRGDDYLMNWPEESGCDGCMVSMLDIQLDGWHFTCSSTLCCILSQESLYLSTFSMQVT